MANMGWRIIQEPDSLWAKAVCRKYMQGDIRVENFIPKYGASNLWQGITKAHDLLFKGIRRSIGNGKSILFWGDRWIMEEPLINFATFEINIVESFKCVVDY